MVQYFHFRILEFPLILQPTKTTRGAFEKICRARLRSSAASARRRPGAQNDGWVAVQHCGRGCGIPQKWMVKTRDDQSICRRFIGLWIWPLPTFGCANWVSWLKVCALLKGWNILKGFGIKQPTTKPSHFPDMPWHWLNILNSTSTWLKHNWMWSLRTTPMRKALLHPPSGNQWVGVQ